MSIEKFSHYIGRECAMNLESRLVHLPPHAMKMLQEHRANAHCRGCGQRISEAVRWQIREASTFHPSCAAKFDAQRQSPPAPAAAHVRAIGIIHGCAAEYGRTYNYGGVPESVESWSFSRSLRKGGIQLRIDHDPNQTIPARPVLGGEGDGLMYYATVFDSPIGRDALQRAERGEFHGTSLAFKKPTDLDYHNGRESLVYDSLDVTELSLCLNKAPAWTGTTVRGVTR